MHNILPQAPQKAHRIAFESVIDGFGLPSARDGSANPDSSDAALMERIVWAGQEIGGTATVPSVYRSN